MNGTTWALGAVGALALLGSSQRGSAGKRATSGSRSAYSKADVEALGYTRAEIERALAAMEHTPSGRSAGPNEASRMDTDYRGLDFTPTQAMRDAAMKGLRLRKLNEARGKRVDRRTGQGPGGLWIGVGRAIQLATAARIPPRDVRRMADYHRRHTVDKRGEGFGDEARPSNGYVAWLLWGSDLGDEGQVWSQGLVERMDALDGRRGSRASQEDYRGSHMAPSSRGGAPLWDLTVLYPQDVYSHLGPRYYSSGMDYDNEAFSVVHAARGRRDKQLRIYRAVPRSLPRSVQINPGDWVAIVRKYAIDHGESALRGDYRIISKLVSARDVFTDADSIQEWGYDPQPYTPLSQRDPSRQRWPGKK